MKSKNKLKYVLLLIFINSFSFAQMDSYKYKRPIKEVSEQWHEITLPNDMFGKVSKDFSDIRIIGVTESNDTIEIPFLMRQSIGKHVMNNLSFKRINESYNSKGYYYTFESPECREINLIKLDVLGSNFDYKIKLEGSNEQEEWFTILDDYRIISIKNKHTDYHYTNLEFPESKYLFYRVLFKDAKLLKLNNVSLYKKEVLDGKFRDYEISKFKVSEEKKEKRTYIDLDLKMPVSISYLGLNVKDSIDYYRPITIKYLTDSFKTDYGWRYSYKTLATGVLSSIEEKAFLFESVVAQKLKIVVDNYDNEPLNISGVFIKGYLHQMLARFSSKTKADYFIIYGNSKARKPIYDIANFKNNIPSGLKSLSLGEEIKIEVGNENEKVLPLFRNEVWLWGIMGGIIIVLSVFTFKMMKKH